MQLVKRECVSQTTKRKTLPALNESIEKVKGKNLTRDAEKGRNEINHPAYGERKKAASMETEWRMGSVKAQRGLGFLVLEGEVDACRYCTLGVHHPARWMSCFTKAERCHQSGLRKSGLPVRYTVPSSLVILS